MPVLFNAEHGGLKAATAMPVARWASGSDMMVYSRKQVVVVIAMRSCSLVAMRLCCSLQVLQLRGGR